MDSEGLPERAAEALRVCARGEEEGSKEPEALRQPEAEVVGEREGRGLLDREAVGDCVAPPLLGLTLGEAEGEPLGEALRERVGLTLGVVEMAPLAVVAGEREGVGVRLLPAPPPPPPCQWPPRWHCSPQWCWG
jgi:hypothetical protein